MRSQGLAFLLLALGLHAAPATRLLTASKPARALGIAAGEHRHVRLRVSEDGVRWSGWRDLDVDAEAGTLLWLETPVQRAEVEGAGDARLLLIDPGVTPPRTLSAGIVGRAEWCPSPFRCPANPDPVPTTPTHLIVHHTATGNEATDWPAVMRSIWEFHTKGNGWADIGYNFLIDPNGVAYEGRGDSVLGAHFSGVNTGTTGISMLGTYTDRPPSAAALARLLEILQWQAEKHQLDPLGQTLHAASGLELNVISGHRDAGLAPRASGRTECPGLALYPLLPQVRAEVCRALPGCLPLSQRVNTCGGGSGPCVARYGIVNTASYDARPVTPNSIAAAFGTGLTGLRVTVNDRAATLVGASENQLNFLLPAGTETGTARLRLLDQSGVKAERLFWVTEAAPAIYAGGMAAAGAPVEIYLTGAVDRTLAWSATVGGKAADRLYLGPAPGIPGLWQCNIVVPRDVDPGLQPVVLNISGVPSAAFSLQVQ